VFNPSAEGIDDRRGRSEVHVRDPKRQNIALLVVLPLLRVCPPAIGRRVEIEIHRG
jgi:hypothetical protein